MIPYSNLQIPKIMKCISHQIMYSSVLLVVKIEDWHHTIGEERSLKLLVKVVYHIFKNKKTRLFCCIISILGQVQKLQIPCYKWISTSSLLLYTIEASTNAKRQEENHTVWEMEKWLASSVPFKRLPNLTFQCNTIT